MQRNSQRWRASTGASMTGTPRRGRIQGVRWKYNLYQGRWYCDFEYYSHRERDWVWYYFLLGEPGIHEYLPGCQKFKVFDPEFLIATTRRSSALRLIHRRLRRT